HLIVIGRVGMHGCKQLFLLDKIKNWLKKKEKEGNIGLERKGYVYNEIVKPRHYSLSYGICRSGDLTNLSLINKLSKELVKNILKEDIPTTKSVIILPFATEISIVLILLTLKQYKPKAKYVITDLKSIKSKLNTFEHPREDILCVHEFLIILKRLETFVVNNTYDMQSLSILHQS
ncbi:hypothetical protein RFI_01763, partial [Reticulomyxa filosa]